MVNSFHVIRPRVTKLDIYYKVYVIHNSFYFIKTGGQFYNRHAYDEQLSDILGLLLLPWFKKNERKQFELEMEYDQKILSGRVSELLNEKNNFSINNREIEEIVINRRGTLHTFFEDNGTISFNLVNGRKFKFIIPKTTIRSAVTENITEVQPTLCIRETKRGLFL